MNSEDYDKIAAAVAFIEAGNSKRVDVSDRIKVYLAGTVIRIDITKEK